jgi:hypothetical protein
LREPATRGKYDEITISYRKHASHRFPQAAVRDFNSKQFRCFTVDGKGEGATLIKDRPTLDD